MRLKPSGSQASPLITNSHLNKSTTNKHWAAGSKLKADIPLLCFPIATSPRKPLFSLYSLTSPLFFFFLFLPPTHTPHWCLPPHSRPQLTQARNPGHPNQHCFKATRVQWVQQAVTWVELLLIYRLEQLNGHLPQAQSLSFAQTPLGQYTAGVKEC